VAVSVSPIIGKRSKSTGAMLYFGHCRGSLSTENVCLFEFLSYLFLTVREGLTGPEEAPFAGTTCQKICFSSSTAGRVLCSPNFSR
jgi:hypothetical protein